VAGSACDVEALGLVGEPALTKPTRVARIAEREQPHEPPAAVRRVGREPGDAERREQRIVLGGDAGFELRLGRPAAARRQDEEGRSPRKAPGWPPWRAIHSSTNRRSTALPTSSR
jgi:hypothetical protein